MTEVSSFEVEEPILSSPFEEPVEHWWIEEGKLPERRPGRRPAGYFYRDPTKAPSDDGISRGEWVEIETHQPSAGQAGGVASEQLCRCNPHDS